MGAKASGSPLVYRAKVEVEGFCLRRCGRRKTVSLSLIDARARWVDLEIPHVILEKLKEELAK